MSAHCAAIGKFTNRVVASQSAVVACLVCSRAFVRGSSPPKHDCPRNYYHHTGEITTLVPQVMELIFWARNYSKEGTNS